MKIVYTITETLQGIKKVANLQETIRQLLPEVEYTPANGLHYGRVRFDWYRTGGTTWYEGHLLNC